MSHSWRGLADHLNHPGRFGKHNRLPTGPREPQMELIYSLSIYVCINPLTNSRLGIASIRQSTNRAPKSAPRDGQATPDIFGQHRALDNCSGRHFQFALVIYPRSITWYANEASSNWNVFDLLSTYLINSKYDEGHSCETRRSAVSTIRGAYGRRARVRRSDA